MSDEARIAEGFPHQRLVILPSKVLQRCRLLPLVEQLYITHIGSYPSAPRHYVKRAGVGEVIMIYCFKGRGFLELNGRTFKIQQGHVAFIPHGTPHVYRSSRKDPWSIYWIHYSGKQKNKVTENLGLSSQLPLLYMPDVSIIKNAFEDIYACLNYNFSDAGLFAMSSEFMRLLSKIKLGCGAPQKEKQAMEGRIAATIEFMERHTDMKLTLEGLAAQAGLSVPHYSKLFKQRTDESPMSYFTQLKILKACELLYKTDEPVHQVAEQLGYEDPFYFSRQFKKFQGMSPSEYRNWIFR